MKRAKGNLNTYLDIMGRRENLYSKLTLLFSAATSKAYDETAFTVARQYAHICATFYGVTP